MAQSWHINCPITSTWHSSSDALAAQTFLVYKLMKGYTRVAGKETTMATRTIQTSSE